MIKQGKHRHNPSSDPVSTSFDTSAVLSPSCQCSRIFTIPSESSRSIPAIIKNVCIVSKIHTIGLDTTAHTNHKIGTPISLRRIGQFLLDRRPQQRDLSAMDQVVVDK